MFSDYDFLSLFKFLLVKEDVLVKEKSEFLLMVIFV